MSDNLRLIMMPLLTKTANSQRSLRGRRVVRPAHTGRMPSLIEILPLADEPLRAEITVPGSKSITNRALILAALADGEVVLRGALWSEDTRVMVDALKELGFKIHTELDSKEFCNRTITVKGLGGKIPNAGTAEKPLELFVGNAGTAARFLAVLVCLGKGYYSLQGIDRMKDRPFAALLAALRQLGYSIKTENHKLPALIHGTGPCPGKKCRVKIDESSQFASALLLSAKIGHWNVLIEGEKETDAPYVKMTKMLCEIFPHQGGTFDIEPDASSGSYFWAADWLLSQDSHRSISVVNWPKSGFQIDENFRNYLPLPPIISRQTDLGDSIMTAIMLAPFAKLPTKFVELGRLRVQETERVFALRTELTKCGAKVIEDGDTLTVYPSKLHGARVKTYNDHRMAMCFSILGLKVPGMKIEDPACVKKTFPDFFQKLAAPALHGLRTVIRDAITGKKLTREELFIP